MMYTRRMRTTAAMVASCAFPSVGCSSDEPAVPTPFEGLPAITWVEYSGPAPAHSWFCVTTVSAGPGPITARVAPTSYYIQLHAGDCSAPDSLVAESNSGTVTAAVALGQYHVKVGNPTDEVGAYSVRVEYPSS